MTERDWEEFKAEYHLSKQHLAPLIGVGPLSITKYINQDKSLQGKTIAKVERGIKFVIENNLVAPVWNGGNNASDCFTFKRLWNEYQKKVKEYDECFKDLFNKS